VKKSDKSQDRQHVRAALKAAGLQVTAQRLAVYQAVADSGIIRRIQPMGSAARYEHRVDNHHHLICRQCDNLVDVDCAVGKAPCLKAKQNHGYEIDEAEVTYWGVCPACQKRATGKSG